MRELKKNTTRSTTSKHTSLLVAYCDFFKVLFACLLASTYCWKTRRLMAAKKLFVFSVMSDGNIAKVKQENLI